MKQQFMIVKKVPVPAANTGIGGLSYEGFGLKEGVLGLKKYAAFKETGKKPEKAFTLEIETEELDPAEVAKAKAKDDVVDVVRSIKMQLIAPKGGSQDCIKPAGGQSCWGRDSVGVPATNYTGKGVTVAVLDTGIDPAHDAFAGLQILEEDFTGEGNGDKHGHGTHCAGTIAGKPVKGMAIGMAPGIDRLLAGKVIGARGGSSEQIKNAIDWAVKNGANVISMSLGIDFAGFAKDLIARGLPEELAASIALEAYRKNVGLFEHLVANLEYQSMNGYIQPLVVVAASGNESQREKNPDFVIDTAPPAIAKGIISVAAVGLEGAGLGVAEFSNTGALLCAPGVDIISAGPGKDCLVTMSGTSMATPHVAGVAALWAEQLISQKRFTYTNLRSKLMASCRQTGLSPYNMVDFGAGIVMAP